jgi:ABC-type transporter Mla MlaB component
MYQLSQELIINDVVTLKQNLLAELEKEGELVLDVSNVSKIDTASIQLLCALQKHLLTTQHAIAWHGESEAILRASATLGVREFLGLS